MKINLVQTNPVVVGWSLRERDMALSLKPAYEKRGKARATLASEADEIEEIEMKRDKDSLAGLFGFYMTHVSLYASLTSDLTGSSVQKLYRGMICSNCQSVTL